MAVKAFVLIEVGVGRTKEVAQSLERTEGIQSVDPVTGPYDIIAVIEQPSIDVIGELITKRIHSLPGVSKTTTCIAMKLS